MATDKPKIPTISAIPNRRKSARLLITATTYLLIIRDKKPSELSSLWNLIVVLQSKIKRWLVLMLAKSRSLMKLCIR